MDEIENGFRPPGKHFILGLTLIFFDNLVRRNTMTIKFVGIGGMEKKWAKA